MKRREVRYNLYRIKNQLEGGAKASPPKGFKKKFESNPLFKLIGGFLAFSDKWDVSEDDPFEIVALEKSHLERWNDHLREVAKELPGLEYGSETNV